MNKPFLKILFPGLLLELLIIAYAYFIYEGEPLQICARYSGRLSLYFFLTFFIFMSRHWAQRRTEYKSVFQKGAFTFAILHVIHLALLLMYVYSAHIELVPLRLAGGILAYLLLVLFPIGLHYFKLPQWLDYVYFYYVLLVMALTLVARVKGGFERVEPAPIHFINLGLIAVGLITHVYLIRKK